MAYVFVNTDKYEWVVGTEYAFDVLVEFGDLAVDDPVFTFSGSSSGDCTITDPVFTFAGRGFSVSGDLAVDDPVFTFEAQGAGDLRGPRRRRKGRGNQAHHTAAESAHLPRGRPGRAHRAGEDAVVLPALRRPSARRR